MPWREVSSSLDWVKVAAGCGVKSESSESRSLGAELSSELPGPCSPLGSSKHQARYDKRPLGALTP